MADMRVKDFDEFKSPSRKPWLLILVAAILLGVALWILRDEDESEPAVPGPTTDEPAAVVSPEAPSEPVGVEPVNEGSAPESEPAASDPGPEPEPIANVEALLKQAEALAKSEQHLEARRVYESILAGKITPSTRRTAEAALGKLNIFLVTTPYPMAEKVEHVVGPGDSLDKISKQYGTTVGLIQRCYGLSNPNIIKRGDRFMVLKAPFSITVSKRRNDLLLKLDGKFFKRYRVGTGKYGRTPTGTFEISERIKEPVWWRPDGKEVPFTGDPKGENILGTRWMTLLATGQTPAIKGYGIHGSWDESSIGKAESAGCVRMRNREVEELYMLVPVGTPVTIVE